MHCRSRQLDGGVKITFDGIRNDCTSPYNDKLVISCANEHGLSGYGIPQVSFSAVIFSGRLLTLNQCRPEQASIVHPSTGRIVLCPKFFTGTPKHTSQCKKLDQPSAILHDVFQIRYFKALRQLPDTAISNAYTYFAIGKS